jgi:hypothetical protein
MEKKCYTLIKVIFHICLLRYAIFFFFMTIYFFNLEFWLNSVNNDLLNLHKEILTTDDWFEKRIE